jgi:pyrimidine deaminase RibD-like protein
MHPNGLADLSETMPVIQGHKLTVTLIPVNEFNHTYSCLSCLKQSNIADILWDGYNNNLSKNTVYILIKNMFREDDAN